MGTSCMPVPECRRQYYRPTGMALAREHPLDSYGVAAWSAVQAPRDSLPCPPAAGSPLTSLFNATCRPTPLSSAARPFAPTMAAAPAAVSTTAPSEAQPPSGRHRDTRQRQHTSGASVPKTFVLLDRCIGSWRSPEAGPSSPRSQGATAVEASPSSPRRQGSGVYPSPGGSCGSEWSLPESCLEAGGKYRMDVPVKNTFIQFGTDPKQPVRSRSSPAKLLTVPFGTRRVAQQQARLEHVQGQCRPCAYYWGKEDGCRRGNECSFCHLCDPSELRRRRKAKDRALRLQDLLAGEPVAGRMRSNRIMTAPEL